MERKYSKKDGEWMKIAKAYGELVSAQASFDTTRVIVDFGLEAGLLKDYPMAHSASRCLSAIVQYRERVPVKFREGLGFNGQTLEILEKRCQEVLSEALPKIC